MATTTKYILEKIKIDGVLQDLLTKTNGDNATVVYNGEEQTLTSALAAILASITSLPTAANVDAAISSLRTELMGEGVPEAYDTFRELADYIATHQEAADALTAAIGNKADAADLTAAVARIADLEAKKVAEADLDTDLAAKVNAASEGNHSHANKAELDKIATGDVEKWNGIRGVRYGTEFPADMQEGELFVRVVSATTTE